MALYYKHAAIAIRRSDVATVLAAKELSGKTVVEPYTFTGHNFLVGNTKNPKNVIFTHYDCWESGAVDNASGTAVLMSLVVNNPEVLKENLFVIAGTEEISYDEPIYWGKGYREFQKEYADQLQKAELIIVIDCVGYSEHEWVTDPSHVMLGLPLDNFEAFSDKCKMICGDFDKLMKVYHSNDDTIDLLSEKSLQEAQKLLIKAIYK
jgi:Iap family predicted aminopeptidase